VTLGAVVAELAAVSVVAAMTADARVRYRDPPRLDGGAMTRVAIETCVRAFEPEIRLRIVIEPPRRPIERRVA
jgi:hypothetical protein